jgi:hypothetical protein
LQWSVFLEKKKKKVILFPTYKKKMVEKLL